MIIIISELASRPSIDMGTYAQTLLCLTHVRQFLFIQLDSLLHHHVELVGLPATGKDDKSSHYSYI